MAGRRKSWESLSPAYRGRLSRGGISKSQYESGVSLAKARGHGQTPEHPREAERHPERYRKYREKHQKFREAPTPQTPEDEAYELNTARDNAYRNEKGRLGNYIKYNDANVIARVYGGIINGEEQQGMSLGEARWTAQADTEELRSRASEQYRFNPWWYH
jgi:hypothetical protein